MAVEAEQALLGSLLSNNAKTADRCQFLRPEHFADAIHGKIFERAIQRIAVGLVADAVTLKVDFENTGVLEDCGGTKYLTQLLTCNIGWMATSAYAKAIHDTWLRRQLIDIGADVTDQAFGAEPGADATELVTRAAELVLALGESAVQHRGTDFATAAKRAVERTDAAQQNRPGFGALDTGIAWWTRCGTGCGPASYITSWRGRGRARRRS